MSIILLSSPEAGAGKTTLAVSIGQRLLRQGKTVGYRRLAGVDASEDARFVRSSLRQSEPLEVLLPDAAQLAASLDRPFDALFVEVSDDRIAAEIMQMPEVIPLIVARFQVDGLVSRVMEHARAIGASRANVVINAVPEKGQRQINGRVLPELRDSGFNVIGAIPQDRSLIGPSVGELAQALKAEILCADDQLDLPVEAVMISAMSDEGAESYFRRIPRKAVVVSGDRPDVQMPALATDTSCIVLCENFDPDPTVFKTADDQGVPLLKVTPDTLTILERISDALDNTRFHQQYKIARAVSLIASSLDEGALNTALGVAGREVA
ncbi:MAG TPA: DRTGG domain-containing protein [Chloroflexota bacterium]|nr:DRTGG domain-containing protein [Chloroflexota bacterium]